MQLQIWRKSIQFFPKCFIAIKPERLLGIKRTRDNKENGRYSEPLQLWCHYGRVAPFTVVKCEQAERALARTIQAFRQFVKLNEIEPAIKHFDMEARLLAVQYMFIDNDASCLEVMDYCEGNCANNVQHSIARSPKTCTLRNRAAGSTDSKCRLITIW